MIWQPDKVFFVIVYDRISHIHEHVNFCTHTLCNSLAYLVDQFMRLETPAFIHRAEGSHEFTSEGITLVVKPPWNELMESTEGEKGFLFRLIICCRATTIWEATNIVSTVN